MGELLAFSMALLVAATILHAHSQNDAPLVCYPLVLCGCHEVTKYSSILFKPLIMSAPSSRFKVTDEISNPGFVF